MIGKRDILTIDKHGIYACYEEWPKHAKIALEKEFSINIDKPSSIVIAGMGGSGSVGDIIFDLLSNNVDIPIYIIKGYNLPSYINRDHLLISISVSGNTEEMISITKEAYSRGIKTICVSSGGLLEKLCKDYNYMHIKITNYIAPRYSLCEVLFTILNLVSNIKELSWIKIKARESINMMQYLKDIISIDNEINNISKELTYFINNNIPVIYTSPYNKGIGIRFKNSLNENAKVLALTSDIIEASHNEIVAWSKLDGFKPIFVKNPKDTESIVNRFKAFKYILNEYRHDVFELPIFSNDQFINTLASMYVLEYTSYYLALYKNIDPFAIEPIVKLKELNKYEG